MEVCTLHRPRLVTPLLSFLLEVSPLAGCQLQNLPGAFLGAPFADLSPDLDSLNLILDLELLSPN